MLRVPSAFIAVWWRDIVSYVHACVPAWVSRRARSAPLRAARLHVLLITPAGRAVATGTRAYRCGGPRGAARAPGAAAPARAIASTTLLE